VKNTALMYGASAAGGAIQYIVLVLLARTLGPSRLGAVVLASTVSGLLAAAVEFGVGPVLIRYRPQLQSAEPELWQAVLGITTRVVCGAAAAIVVLIGCAEAVLAVTRAGSDLAPILGFSGAIAVPTVLLTFSQSYMQAEQRFRAIAGITVGIAGLRLVLTSGLLAAGLLTAETALGAYAVATIAAGAVSWWWAGMHMSLPRPRRDTREQARRLVLPYLRWTMIGRAAVALNGNLDVVLLSALAGARATGVYGAASQSAAPIAMLATSVGEVSFPHLAARERQQTNRAFVSRWLGWLPLILIGGCACGFVGAALLPRVLGSSFRRASGPFVLLAILYSLHIWLQPVGSLLYASDRQRFAAGLAVAQAIALLALDVALIPSLGAAGPPVAALITTVASAPMMLVVALRCNRPSAGLARFAAGVGR
jgi:O-antigen/teichoic acid export membrane protein